MGDDSFQGDTARGGNSTQFAAGSYKPLPLLCVADVVRQQRLQFITAACPGCATPDHDACHGADEVGKLSVAFNDMAAEIERHEALRRQMVADVAHELRTPLSVMRGNIEAMMDGLLQPSQDELSEVHDEVLRLTRMVEDLRLLSMADAGKLHLKLEPLDAGELVQTTVRRMTPLAEARDVAIQGQIPDRPVTVRGDEDKLLQALANAQLVGAGARPTRVVDGHMMLCDVYITGVWLHGWMDGWMH